MVGFSKIRFTFLRESTTESENICKMAKKYKNAKNYKNIFLLKLNKKYVSYTLETLLPKILISNTKKCHFLHIKGAKSLKNYKIFFSSKIFEDVEVTKCKNKYGIRKIRTSTFI